MGLQSKLVRVFNGLIIGATVMGLCYEAVHMAAEPPQPHTDQHERIEHRMSRLREAEGYRALPRAAMVGGAGRTPRSQPGPFPAVIYA